MLPVRLVLCWPLSACLFSKFCFQRKATLVAFFFTVNYAYIMLAAKKFKSFVNAIEDIVPNNAATKSPQSTCLNEYLCHLKAGSYIIEERYTDANFLVDYANYYSRCHNSYNRLTHRIHFFRDTDQDLNEKISKWLSHGNNCSDFSNNGNYIGFVVIKPLPKTFIGRTCLATYPLKEEKSSRIRNFPIKRTYNVTLHGIPLSVDTIAFQEQDREIAACATTAIWFALHGMPKKITTNEIASPFEITNASSNTYTKRALGDVSRRFPTGGLSLEQIENYLRQYGLECIVCGVLPSEKDEKIKDYLASYVNGGYPMIAVGDIYTSKNKESGFKKQGLHAITVLGYAQGMNFEHGSSSQLIDRLFAHDDNIGPFSRFDFSKLKQGEFLNQLEKETHSNEVDDILKSIKGEKEKPVEHYITHFLESKLKMAPSSVLYRRLVPKYMILPVNGKIRLPYEIVSALAKQISTVFEKRKTILTGDPNPPSCGWSIDLLEVSAVKKYISSLSSVSRDEDYFRQLCMPMPKHIWKLSFFGCANGEQIPWVDIFLDATDLLQGSALLTVLTHNQNTYGETFGCAIAAFSKEWVERYPHEIDPDVEPIIMALYCAYK